MPKHGVKKLGPVFKKVTEGDRLLGVLSNAVMLPN